MSLACTAVSPESTKPRIPKRKLVIQILAFDDQKGWVPAGKKHVFNPRHCSLRDLCIDHQWFATLLTGTSYTADDVLYHKTFFLSFGEREVKLMPNASATMATYILNYNHTLILQLGEKLHLRLRAITE